MFKILFPFPLFLSTNPFINPNKAQETSRSHKQKKEERYTLFFLLIDDSPAKNFISGCVRSKSRSICSAISVNWKEIRYYEEHLSSINTRKQFFHFKMGISLPEKTGAKRLPYHCSEGDPHLKLSVSRAALQHPCRHTAHSNPAPHCFSLRTRTV